MKHWHWRRHGKSVNLFVGRPDIEPVGRVARVDVYDEKGERMAVVHPPWKQHQISGDGADHLSAQGWDQFVKDAWLPNGTSIKQERFALRLSCCHRIGEVRPIVE